MKKLTNIWIFAILCWLLTGISSCKDDTPSAGASALKDGENVVVKADTLRNIHSAIVKATPIVFTPDSFLLGECSRPHLGTIKADILAQFACPNNWTYPDSSVLDSVRLILFYRSWHGDGNTPLGITIYEMDGETLNYDSTYASDVPVERFCSMDESLRANVKDRLVVASQPVDSIYYDASASYLPYLQFRMTDRFAQKLFSIRDFSSQEAFSNLFKGLYITSNYGGSTALYVFDISLEICYHYTVLADAATNTYETFKDTKYLYANNEVRQVNRYEYIDHDALLSTLQADTNVNYVISPAGLYTQLNIPIKQIRERIQAGVGNKRPYINLANLTINVLNGESEKNNMQDDWSTPAETMMLIKQDSLENFFRYGKLPDDTYAMYSQLIPTLNDSDKYEYIYSFDMSTLLMMEQRDTTNVSDTLKMVLLPVHVEMTNSTSSSYVSAVKLEQTVTATKIRSSQNTKQPIDIEVVYSGFSDIIVK
ncbi:MAG: DUF4270 domain-containing protein [Paludibacteraceae bacterium]|nr:DUF4270 domain-containing protein [Paludibacteraceae bacterium]